MWQGRGAALRQEQPPVRHALARPQKSGSGAEECWKHVCVCVCVSCNGEQQVRLCSSSAVSLATRAAHPPGVVFDDSSHMCRVFHALRPELGCLPEALLMVCVCGDAGESVWEQLRTFGVLLEPFLPARCRGRDLPPQRPQRAQLTSALSNRLLYGTTGDRRSSGRCWFYILAALSQLSETQLDGGGGLALPCSHSFSVCVCDNPRFALMVAGSERVCAVGSDSAMANQKQGFRVS